MRQAVGGGAHDFAKLAELGGVGKDDILHEERPIAYRCRWSDEAFPSASRRERKNRRGAKAGVDRLTGRWCRRTMGVVGRNGLLLALVIGAPAACDPLEPPCEPSPTLDVLIPPELRDGHLEIDGACTDLRCYREAETGCAEWHARMTSSDPSELCRVTLVRVDGRRDSKAVHASESCGGPAGRIVRF